MEWDDGSPESDARLLEDLGLDESSPSEDARKRRLSEDSPQLTQNPEHGVQGNSIFTNLSAALEGTSSDSKSAADSNSTETSKEMMEIPKTEFCRLNKRLIQRNREVRESVQKFQEAEKRVVMLNRLVKSLKSRTLCPDVEVKKRVNVDDLVDQLTEEEWENNTSFSPESISKFQGLPQGSGPEKKLQRVERELKQSTSRVAEVQQKCTRAEEKLQTSEEKIAFMEQSAKLAETKLASIRLRDNAQVNKMMAALGANEEAAQQMVLDAKWENDILKKDIGLLQVQKTNLQEKLETEKVMREKAQRNVLELRAQLERCSGEAELARRDQQTWFQKIEDVKKRLELAERQALVDRRACKEKYTKLAEEKIISLKNKLEKKLATKVKQVQKYHEAKAANVSRFLARSNALHKELWKIVSLGKSIIKNTRLDLASGQRDILRTLKFGCRRLSIMGGAEVQELKKKYAREVALRKKYWDKIQELRGNIRVFCRVRPMLKKESEAGHRRAVTFPADGGVEIYNADRNSHQSFSFDEVFKPSSTQTQIFDRVRGLIRSVCDGFHVCIFAYGQTGTGKTYTMQGPSNNPGVNSRALALLFHTVQTEYQNHDFSLAVTLLEIYNEKIVDLMRERTSDSKRPQLKPREGKEGITVPGLTKTDVRDAADVQNILVKGERNRSIGKTDMNQHSSRSHLILTVFAQSTDRTTKKTTMGKLHLIDLAGSERLKKSKAEGARRTETKHINMSLSSLGDVIAAKANSSSHVPYRNSTLTYLLKDSMDKKAKMVMFVQVSPIQRDAAESCCSLMFATRANKVELGHAEVRKTRLKKVALRVIKTQR